jgi:uncharacterized protein YceH (UPF0502 family)
MDALFKESKSKNAAPAKLELDRLEYGIKDDEELKRIAEADATKTTEDKYKALKASADGAISAAAQNKSALEDRKDGDIAALKAEIASLKKQIDDDTLKRGLQRSSIATGRRDAIDAAGISSVESYTQSYNAAVSELDKKIADLKAGFDADAKSLQFDKAYETEKKLEALIKERDGLVADMTKYNNTVTEKENDYIMQYNKYVADMQAAENKNGASPELTAEYGDRYMLALGFYDGLDKKTASRLIADNAYLKTYLGGDYYARLRARFGD